jgi:predicted Zn finger-like uncharacterized protein
MYTRCPDCDSAHVVNAALLASARGSMRCGRCGCKFDALEQLFDEWPGPEDTPPPAGKRYRPPVLGSKKDLVAPFGPAYVHFPAEQARRTQWLVIALILTLLTLMNLAWTFRTELESLPQARALLQDFKLLEPLPEATFRAPGQFQVVSRDLHSHPTQAGLLVLSATFVNRAERAQPWPQLELTLLDLGGNPLARRSFEAAEYVPGGGSRPGLLRPQAHVPVLLEFVSPGDVATGFEIDFR